MRGPHRVDETRERSEPAEGGKGSGRVSEPREARPPATQSHVAHRRFASGASPPKAAGGTVASASRGGQGPPEPNPTSRTAGAQVAAAEPLRNTRRGGGALDHQFFGVRRFLRHDAGGLFFAACSQLFSVSPALNVRVLLRGT